MRTFGSGKSIRKMDKSTYEQAPAQRAKSNSVASVQRALASGAPLQAADIHTLQRSIGNSAAKQLTAGSGKPIMAKMTINQPTDAYELEADQVAFRVASDLQSDSKDSDSTAQRAEEQGESEEEELQLKADSAGAIQREEQGETEEEELQLKPDSAGSIQREEQGETEEEELQLKADSAGAIQREEQGETEEEELQLKVDSAGAIQREEQSESEEEELQLKADSAGAIQREEQSESEEEELQLKRDPFSVIQRAEDGAPAEASPGVEESINELRGKGQPLPDRLRQQLEDSFGADFSKVSIHTDNAADDLAKKVGARAFTTGNDIFFRQGEYKPGTASGLQLLSHELTHIVQQN
ncbi:DUF4157 domain-containing protein [Paenibacillus sp. CF384]|uniref:eCIS core domain-containing protein n=1 Tax=Paenibacillus sp. CF384 TaxID=1884382 RepID=UPI00089C48AE|nr:DUF4157 domain-containing protein [Paenibacillus sp. CF384]SDW55551.1 protein of unknown function [Paenibacillus sp. CF384]